VPIPKRLGGQRIQVCNAITSPDRHAIVLNPEWQLDEDVATSMVEMKLTSSTFLRTQLQLR